VFELKNKQNEHTPILLILKMYREAYIF